MSRKYKFHNPGAAYFVSFAVVNWINVFTIEAYFNVMLDSLEYCRNKKGLILFAYCIMPSHVHLLFRDEKENPSGLLRDLKGFSSKKLLKTIQEHPKESRREWMMETFRRAGEKNSNVMNYQFWQQNNHPMELWSTPIIRQKFNYIHKNPVKAGLVTEPWEWQYSSARNYAELDAEIEIDNIGFLG